MCSNSFDSSGVYSWKESASIALSIPAASASFVKARFEPKVQMTPPMTVASGITARIAAEVSTQN